jgi:cyclopropane-fatty-acyl-phospholipid synthase
MTDHVEARKVGAAGSAPLALGRPSLLGRFAGQFSQCTVPFEVVLPDGAVQRFGKGAPSFTVTLKNRRGLRAITSVDEGRIGDAYLNGDIEIEGDMLRRPAVRTTSPLARCYAPC